MGQDEYAATLKAKAEEGGTVTEYFVSENPTGTCAVLITGNDRSLVANISAANDYKDTHLTEVGMPLLEKAKIVYISGFFLTVSPPSIQIVGKHCNENGKTFMMNLAAPFICEFFKDPLGEALKHADVVFGNESEYAAYAKVLGYDTDDLTEIALRLSRSEKLGAGKRICICTQGAEPTIIATDGEARKYPILPMTPEEIVDTNGAGDAWVGGFIAARATGKNLEDSCKAAAYAAKVVIGRSGCTMPEAPAHPL